eukprot:gnl/TRDRNA2_/TRDRNA2_53402_c0_seq1.p1 gnl/TRDRNA2_/TRDRNA2_53402_c0~~gnl/TRDRNA2_/TRDRNA2_53402_c0_seq1.p1  ORF type:complete len:600 (-),score=111.53 gnl/TRDRNA2_/TRDRNA2_53402_c0_seq1:106-1905(-)
MTAAAGLQIFEEYRRFRVNFVETVAELASWPHNADVLQSAGLVALLRPLLLDPEANVQQTAALALGRLAKCSSSAAASLGTCKVLTELVSSLHGQNTMYKQVVAFALREVAKHSPDLAQEVVDCGALDALVTCLEDSDLAVRQAVVWPLDIIARHTESLANTVVESGAVEVLVKRLEDADIALRRISSATLADICRHSAELAQRVVDFGALPPLVRDLSNTDSALKRQICGCLGHIASHSPDLARLLVNAGIFPGILSCLKDGDEFVRKNAATCIRNIASHAVIVEQASQDGDDQADNYIFAVADSIGPMVEYIVETRGDNRLPGIMMLGFVAGLKPEFASDIINRKGIHALKDALVNESEGHLKAAAAWSLGQVGRHSGSHTDPLAEADVPRRLLAVYMQADSSEDLRARVKDAVDLILPQCTNLRALDQILGVVPNCFLATTLHQISTALKTGAAANEGPEERRQRLHMVLERERGALSWTSERDKKIGDDVEDAAPSASMTVAEARARCATQLVPGCGCFTFQGDSSVDGPVAILFKSRWNLTPAEGWTSWHLQVNPEVGSDQLRDVVKEITATYPDAIVQLYYAQLYEKELLTIM